MIKFHEAQQLLINFKNHENLQMWKIRRNSLWILKKTAYSIFCLPESTNKWKNLTPTIIKYIKIFQINIFPQFLIQFMSKHFRNNWQEGEKFNSTYWHEKNTRNKSNLRLTTTHILTTWIISQKNIIRWNSSHQCHATRLYLFTNSIRCLENVTTAPRPIIDKIYLITQELCGIERISLTAVSPAWNRKMGGRENHFRK